MQSGAEPPTTPDGSGASLPMPSANRLRFSIQSARRWSWLARPVGKIVLAVVVVVVIGSSVGGFFLVRSLLHTSKGNDWVSQNGDLGPFPGLRSVAWSGTQFVTVGQAGTILTSPDGRTWTHQKTNIQGLSQLQKITLFDHSSFLQSIVWSGTQFVAVGGSTGLGVILTSSDGRTWTSQDAGTGIGDALTGVVWSGTQFVAVGDSGVILISSDGRTWTSQDAGTGTGDDFTGVVWSGTQFVVVGKGDINPISSASVILTSPDGRAWIPQNAGSSAGLTGVAWSGTQFLAVGDTSTLLTSSDGRVWTSHNSGISPSLNGGNVTYHGAVWSGNQFVVVGDFGVILTSPDGQAWTLQNTRLNLDLYGVVWSGNQFVVVGSSASSSGIILTSP